MTRKIHAQLIRMSATAVFGICLGTVALLAVIDHWTGFELSFSVFYVIPVFIAAWYANRPYAMGIALLSAIAWGTVDLTSGHRYTHAAIPLWNTAVRLGFFATIAHLLARIRTLTNHEREMARTDTLTGVRNSRGFTEAAQPVLDLARRHGHCTVLCYIDLDNFKAINDAQGHDGGDAVLRRVAEALVHSVRSTDIVGRLGGDEFAILLPETSRPGAEKLSKQFLARILKEAQDCGWPITASIGTVVMASPLPLQEALALADGLMYRVKSAGKNDVLIQEPPARPGNPEGMKTAATDDSPSLPDSCGGRHAPLRLPKPLGA